MNLYYFYLTFIAAVVYLVFQDPNVPKYIELRLQLLRIDIIRFFLAKKLKWQLKRDMKRMERDMRKWMKENGKDKM